MQLVQLAVRGVVERRVPQIGQRVARPTAERGFGGDRGALLVVLGLELAGAGQIAAGAQVIEFVVGNLDAVPAGIRAQAIRDPTETRPQA